VELIVDGHRIGVEVSRLSQLTFSSDGTPSVRETQDAFGVRLLNRLNDELGQLVPSHLCLVITIEVPVSSGTRFRKELTSCVRSIAVSAMSEHSTVRKIPDSTVRISVARRLPGRRSIAGIVANKDSFAGIGHNARILLTDRIAAKSMTCRLLQQQRLWLALLNDYWLADADTYALAARDINLEHPFERVVLVSDQGTACYLQVGRHQATC
jgi:hypothetical protein